jgi:hypothetical protein
MSASDKAEADKCCASCGIAEVDDIKLKKCAACDLVQYCSDECQRGHRQQHEAICKERVAKLRDEILFRQPESSHCGERNVPFGSGCHRRSSYSEILSLVGLIEQ